MTNVSVANVIERTNNPTLLYWKWNNVGVFFIDLQVKYFPMWYITPMPPPPSGLRTWEFETLELRKLREFHQIIRCHFPLRYTSKTINHISGFTQNETSRLGTNLNRL